MRLAILITCHNRVTKTLNCLSSIPTSGHGFTGISVFLVDDGSTDGTSSDVAERFPLVKIIQGSGDLFWSRGMNLAWKTALIEKFDAYLWLNDDVVLAPDALQRLGETLEWHRAEFGKDCIVAGCLTDPQSGSYSYGIAMRNSGWHPGRWRMIEPSMHEPKFAESFHGNVLLVPLSIVEEIGIIDAAFSHAMGDTDYSHRARKAGVSIVATPGYVGTCAMNQARASNLRELTSRTFIPPKDWWILTRRHGGRLLWPIAFFSPYVRSLLPTQSLKHVIPLARVNHRLRRPR